jgi:hypothetical protein
MGRFFDGWLAYGEKSSFLVQTVFGPDKMNILETAYS